MLGARAADSPAIIPKMPVVGVIGDETNGKASFERRCRLERRGTANTEATRQGGNSHQPGCKGARSYGRSGSAEGNAGWNFLPRSEEVRCSQEEITVVLKMPGTRCPASRAGSQCPHVSEQHLRLAVTAARVSPRVSCQSSVF